VGAAGESGPNEGMGYGRAFTIVCTR
jgi:hypothetical protein